MSMCLVARKGTWKLAKTTNSFIFQWKQTKIYNKLGR